MATLEGLSGIELFIREKVEGQRKTYQEVSDELVLLHPSVRSLSRISVRRFAQNMVFTRLRGSMITP